MHHVFSYYDSPCESCLVWRTVSPGWQYWLYWPGVDPAHLPGVQMEGFPVKTRHHQSVCVLTGWSLPLSSYWEKKKKSLHKLSITSSSSWSRVSVTWCPAPPCREAPVLHSGFSPHLSETFTGLISLQVSKPDRLLLPRGSPCLQHAPLIKNVWAYSAEANQLIDFHHRTHPNILTFDI